MKTTFRLLLVSLLFIGTASLVKAQSPAVTHNTWTSGAALPTPVSSSTAAVVKNAIYVVGGNDAAGFGGSGIVADVQIYNATTNTWSTAASIPAGVEWPSSAVVKNILYVFGGTTDDSTASNAVWAYNPKTKAWSGKAAMPTARWGSEAVVEKKTNIIYVIGGYDGHGGYLANVESYNPATNTWTSLAADPTARVESCAGGIGSKLYDAGGYIGNGGAGAATTVNESFQLSSNKWTTLAHMPQGSMFGSSAVYKGRLYCFGGWASFSGTPINNVQIYQP